MYFERGTFSHRINARFMSSHIPGLYMAFVEGKGRGMFTAEPLEPGDIIEICPVIVTPAEELAAIHQTALHDFYFLWGPERDRAAIVLGYGSLYNHDAHPNAEVILDFEEETLLIQCVRSIHPGEEITIHYQDDPTFKPSLWFEEQ